MSFRIPVHLEGDGSSFDKMMEHAKEKTEHSSEHMAHTLREAFSGELMTGLAEKFFAAAGFGGIGELAAQLAESFQRKFEKVNIGSERLGLDHDTFQRISNVAEVEGSSADAIAGVMSKIAVAQAAIREGTAETEKYEKAFATLGITLEQMRSGNYQDIFMKIAGAMQSGEIDSEKLSALRTIGGRGVMSVIPAMKAGFDGNIAMSGNLDEFEMKAGQSLKETNAESGAMWKDSANFWGMVGAATFAGIKSIPRLFTKDLYTKEGQSQWGNNRRAKAAEIELAELNAEKAKKEVEERAEQRRQEHMALMDAEVAADKEKAEAPIRKKISDQEEKNRLAKLKPAAQRKDLEGTIADYEELNALGVLHPSALLHLRQMQGESISLQGGLDKRAGRAGAHIEVDGLAKIGGFAGTGGATAPTKYLERIAKASEATAQHTSIIRPKTRVP